LFLQVIYVRFFSERASEEVRALFREDGCYDSFYSRRLSVV